VLLAVGKTGDAQKAYEDARTSAAVLIKGNSRSTGLRLNLALALDKLGDLALRGADFPRAGVLYREALDLREALKKELPRSDRLQRDLATSHMNLGYVSLRGPAYDAVRALDFL